MSQHASDAPAEGNVSTGRLPGEEEVRRLLVEAYERYRSVDDGVVADYIPALARVPPELFGGCIVSADGRVVTTGDATYRFSIQSVSKPFVFALVCDAIGQEEARQKLGVNSTGLAFNSVMAIELNADRTMNPMVNAGAIATTSLVPGPTAEDKWRNIQDGLSRFAGRHLELDREVYESEAATNLRNQGIAHLLDSYGRLYFDPDEAADVYTRQCSLMVCAEDLAVMGATLADGGVNPRTGVRVIASAICKQCWPSWPRPGCTSGPASGCTTSVSRQERRQRGDRDGLAGQGRTRDVFAAARLGRQQCSRHAAHQAPLRAPRPEHLHVIACRQADTEVMLDARLRRSILDNGSGRMTVVQRRGPRQAGGAPAALSARIAHRIAFRVRRGRPTPGRPPRRRGGSGRACPLRSGRTARPVPAAPQVVLDPGQRQPDAPGGEVAVEVAKAVGGGDVDFDVGFDVEDEPPHGVLGKGGVLLVHREQRHAGACHRRWRRTAGRRSGRRPAPAGSRHRGSRPRRASRPAPARGRERLRGGEPADTGSRPG